MTRDYGLPEDLKFCKKCVMPNTRPASSNEYKHQPDHKHKYIHFDSEGVCSACRFAEAKWAEKTDWQAREAELLALLAKYRSTDGSYDCLVPGSGGKDSCYAAHLLKYKYGMHPLTVTWSPHLYTDIGWQNMQSWIHVGGFDNFLFTPSGKVHRLITRNAFLNLLHPFQPFILGQKTFAAKMAARFDIPLIFYGESPGQYGANTSFAQKKFGLGKDGSSEGHRLDYLTQETPPEDIYLGGRSIADYVRDGWSQGDFAAYLPLSPDVIESKKIEFHFLGYYVQWVPQEAYYYAVEHCGFKANTVRSEGTYSKYSSIDDKTDPFFYYTAYVKFGYGRATQDAAQEIRNRHITREEGVALVKKFDHEFPSRYFKEFLDYVGLTEAEFHATCDKFRSPHIWHKDGRGEWRLNRVIWEDGM